MNSFDVMPSNSDKAKKMEEQNAVAEKPVHKAGAVAERRKKNIFKRAGNALVDGAVKNGKIDFKNGILKPAVDNVIMQTIGSICSSIFGAFETAIFGSSSSGKPWGSYRYGGYDYNKRYRTGSESRVTVVKSDAQRAGAVEFNPRSRETYSFDDFFFRDDENSSGSKKAKDALDEVIDIFESYQRVTVYQFISACGLTPDPQEQNWGWTNLQGAAVRNVMNGAVIDMPKPEYLGK